MSVETKTAGVNPKKQIESFNKFGAYTIPIVAVVTWSVGLAYSSYIGGGWDNIVYGDFATHPALMLSAFLMVGSLSVTCYKLCTYCGISHDVAVLIRLCLNVLIVTLAWLGWYVMWALHNAAGSHYKGSHSRLGLFVLIIWSIYVVTGFYALSVSGPNKMIFEDKYQLFGVMCIVIAMWTAAMGVMWEEYAFDSITDEYGRGTSGAVEGGFLVVIFLIVGMLYYARTLLPK